MFREIMLSSYSVASLDFTLPYPSWLKMFLLRVSSWPFRLRAPVQRDVTHCQAIEFIPLKTRKFNVEGPNF